MQTREVQVPLGRQGRMANLNFSTRKWCQQTALPPHFADRKPHILSCLCIINDLSCRHKKNSQGLSRVSVSLFHTGSGCILKKFSWIIWLLTNKDCGCMCSFWEKLLCGERSCFPSVFAFVPQQLWELQLRTAAVWGAWCNAFSVARWTPEWLVLLLCSHGLPPLQPHYVGLAPTSMAATGWNLGSGGHVQPPLPLILLPTDKSFARKFPAWLSPTCPVETPAMHDLERCSGLCFNSCKTWKGRSRLIKDVRLPLSAYHVLRKALHGWSPSC